MNGRPSDKTRDALLARVRQKEQDLTNLLSTFPGMMTGIAICQIREAVAEAILAIQEGRRAFPVSKETLAKPHIQCGWCGEEDLEIECCPSCGKSGYVEASLDRTQKT